MESWVDAYFPGSGSRQAVLSHGLGGGEVPLEGPGVQTYCD